jgi:hypothetical protein
MFTKSTTTKKGICIQIKKGKYSQARDQISLSKHTKNSIEIYFGCVCEEGKRRKVDTCNNQQMIDVHRLHIFSGMYLQKKKSYMYMFLFFFFIFIFLRIMFCVFC